MEYQVPVMRSSATTEIFFWCRFARTLWKWSTKFSEVINYLGKIALRLESASLNSQTKSPRPG